MRGAAAVRLVAVLVEGECVREGRVLTRSCVRYRVRDECFECDAGDDEPVPEPEGRQFTATSEFVRERARDPEQLRGLRNGDGQPFRDSGV